jgi:hypothetical protein
MGDDKGLQAHALSEANAHETRNDHFCAKKHAPKCQVPDANVPNILKSSPQRSHQSSTINHK